MATVVESGSFFISFLPMNTASVNLDAFRQTFIFTVRMSRFLGSVASARSRKFRASENIPLLAKMAALRTNA